MIEIEYKGGNGITIKSSQAKAVVDPKLSVHGGLKDMKIKGEIEIATEDRFALNDPEAAVIINGPGEYGVADFDIAGYSAARHIDGPEDEKLATNYRIKVGSDARIALLGNVAAKLNEDQLENIGVVDVLILPVGGNGYTLDAKNAAAIVKNIEPKVVIPVSYSDKAINYEVPQDDVELFIKELGAPIVEKVNKYKLKNANSLPDTLTVVQIERS